MPLFALPTVELSEPTLMKQLEKSGLSFPEMIGVSRSMKSNQDLYTDSGYRSMVDSLTIDLKDRLRKDPKLSVTMAKSHRLFDGRWLSSPFAFYELVGVVNRIDRLAFDIAHCGETRLIYRLAYKKRHRGQVIYSRLPMTFNVVFWQPLDLSGCKEASHRWVSDASVSNLTGSKGPLAKTLINQKNLKSVEVNLQAIRWPSTIRPDMGGFAEYFLRVFVKSGSQFQLSKMENTPDVTALRANPRLRKQLLKWILRKDNAKKIDQGIVQIPEKYLAKKASSFALHGLSRKANRPYDQIFSESDFRQLDFSGFAYTRSAKGFLRRLNDMTCVGCHQGRTVAGFHFLGTDRSDTHNVNSVFVGSSPHFLHDQKRRIQFASLLSQAKPIEYKRAFSERADGIDEGNFGSHCGLGDESFKSWHCQPGYQCAATDSYEGDGVGECLPLKPTAGSPCKVGTLIQHRNPKKDRIKRAKWLSCGSTRSVCEVPRVGFPGGMCTGGCDQLGPDETCGAIAILGSFNACLARNVAFSKCLEDNLRPAALRGCDHKRPCRDDYICARSPLIGRKGVCIPPYFLFQLRVDGHPRPI